jgi:S-DNA-T family DNA segregation ATPase FtsK/SpoIIIE
VLRCNDDGEYAAAGLSLKSIPADMPPGRFIDTADGSVAQVALLRDEGEGQARAVVTLAAELTQREAANSRYQPRKVAPLPRIAKLSDWLPRFPPPAQMRKPLLVGLSADTNDLVWLDLATVPGAFFVGGPPGSGKSTALSSAASSFATGEGSVVIVCDSGSPLRHAGLADAVVLATASELGPDHLEGSGIVLIDDAHRLDLSLPPYPDLLAGRRDGWHVVLSATTEQLTSPSSRLAASQTGLLLTPRSRFDGMALGRNLEAGQLFEGPPGRAVYGHGGTLTVVQVLQPDVAS